MRYKVCTKCKESKLFSDFHNNKNAPDGKSHTCTVCSGLRYADSMLKKNYGISLDDYDRMLEEQGGRCKICRTDNACGRGRFHVDHCHNTGEIRGLLCHHCNVGLGNFKDNTVTLANAIAYLNIGEG